MTTVILRERISARPFEPFSIHLADGSAVTVRHPEFIAYGGGRTAVVYTGDETTETLDLLLVTKIVVVRPPAAPAPPPAPPTAASPVPSNTP